MSHVYDGEPDGRQSADVAHPVSRFRPTYRALTDEEKALHDEIKSAAVSMESLIARCGTAPGPMQGRYRALALTALEESIMLAVKALTS